MAEPCLCALRLDAASANLLEQLWVASPKDVLGGIDGRALYERQQEPNVEMRLNPLIHDVVDSFSLNEPSASLLQA
jgi:hypothetical protein